MHRAKDQVTSKIKGAFNSHTGQGHGQATSFLRDLDQVDHYVIVSVIGSQNHRRYVLLELDGAAGIQRDLNEDDILAVAVAWMVFSKIQVSLIVLRFGWTLARC